MVFRNSSSIYGSPTIGSDGTLYFSNDAGVLYAVKDKQAEVVFISLKAPYMVKEDPISKWHILSKYRKCNSKKLPITMVLNTKQEHYRY
jgi:hypothetical protein